MGGLPTSRTVTYTHIVRSKLFHIIQITIYTTGWCIVFRVSENRPLWPCGEGLKGWNEHFIYYYNS